jgi:hypothetical protein
MAGRGFCALPSFIPSPDVPTELVLSGFAVDRRDWCTLRRQSRDAINLGGSPASPPAAEAKRLGLARPSELILASHAPTLYPSCSHDAPHAYTT